MNRRVLTVAAIIALAVMLVAAVWPVTVDTITVEDGNLTALEVTRDTGERYRLASPVPLEPIPSPTPTPPPPPPSGCTDTLSGVVNDPDGFTVAAGDTLCFDPDVSTAVTVDANVVVEGVLVMRPATPDVTHTLAFNGPPASAFAGGHTTTPVASDVGLWVVNNGQLDIAGAPKAGWNRVGDDPTWADTDDLVVAPQAAGDHTTFAAFTRGGPVPTVTGPDGVAYATEVANLTRNVVVEAASGNAHVMFAGCQAAQSIRHAEFNNLGVTGVAGRYPLHFHQCQDGSRGSVVDGVVVEGGRHHAFVPHASHGITFVDTVAYDTHEAPYWWDPPASNNSSDTSNDTHDLVYDRAAALKVTTDDSLKNSGFFLTQGVNLTVRDSVAVGVVSGNVNSGGFHWPGGDDGVWVFDGNVAHNNKDAGMSVWQNTDQTHVIGRFVSYRNRVGWRHGAYRNGYQFPAGGVAFGNTPNLFGRPDADFELWALPNDAAAMRIEGLHAPNIRLGHHRIARPNTPVEFVNARVDVVHVDEKDQPGLIRFTSDSPATDLTPDDFNVVTCLSTIEVVNSDGSTFNPCG